MKIIISIICAVGTLAISLSLTSCDPQKPGGGGKMQSYSSKTGQYN